MLMGKLFCKFMNSSAVKTVDSRDISYLEYVSISVKIKCYPFFTEWFPYNQPAIR